MKEVGRSYGNILKWLLPGLVIVVILGWGLQATGIVSMGIRREVRQQSQQYTETKALLLNKLQNDWLQLDAEIAELRSVEGSQDIVTAKIAQQRSIINRMRLEVDMISDSEVPAHVQSFLATHGR